MPWMSFQTRGLLKELEFNPPRKTIYIQSIVMLTVLGVLAGIVDWHEVLLVSWFGKISFSVLVYGLSIYFLSLGVNLLHGKYFQKEDDPEAEMIMPADKKEYALWFLLCFTAAWSEEYVYRGVFTSLMEHFGMFPFLAAILSATCFSFSHFTQGWLAIPITFAFALAFQYLYKFSGVLLAPVIVHFLYNLSVEFLKRKLVRKEE